MVRSLVDLMLPSDRRAELKAESLQFPSWDLGPRQLCDLDLLLQGAFSSLYGYHDRADYERVCREMRLEDGTLWPMPITLDVTEAFVADANIAPGSRVALRHPEGVLLAVLTVGDVWRPDRTAEALAVLGTTDERHPGVFTLLQETAPVYLGGKVEGVEPVPHYTFSRFRRTPAQQRAEFSRLGWQRIVAFQTRNPMHRAHVELVRRAMDAIDGNALIHPVVGRTSPGDVDYFTRVRCYIAATAQFPEGRTQLGLLPLAMRMGGPREALWHAIIRANFGCTHFIVGRDHAGPGTDAKGRPFYGAYDAQALAMEHAKEIGIEILEFPEMVYVERTDRYARVDELAPGEVTLNVSGTELRRRLRAGEPLPPWFTFPEVATELHMLHPPRARQGFTVFFTGLPSSGKSTLANVLLPKLMEIGTRPVTLLDGDLVRKHLSSELGFSRAHRDLNIQRIGFVASEIAKNGGIAVCAPIAPYAATRRVVREMIEGVGGYVLVHVSTPLEVCEQRDRKGLYAKARAGIVKEFTGISDPYEIPTDADLAIDTTTLSPDAATEKILDHLEREGYVRRAS